ncbi:MAG: GAF domain-containing protein [Chloroflexi bacterium]|nr:GAF domain-containing protein [Chloroflexota bacterium]
MSQHLSLRKAAARLGIHHATLSRAVKRGEIAPDEVTPGGFMRFSDAEVERFYRKRIVYRTSSNSKQERRENISNVDATLASIPDLARRMVQAEYAALAIMDESGKIVNFITSGMSDKEQASIGEPPIGKGLLGVLHSEGKTIRIPNIAEDYRAVGFPPNHPIMEALLGVPIMLNGVNMGNLYLTNKQGTGEFTEHDQEIVEGLAQCAALAIENVRLYARESRLRQEAETERSRLRAIIESSAAGVVVADAKDGSVVLANKEAARIFGFHVSPGEHIEKYEQAAAYRKHDGTQYEIDELPLQRALKEGVTSRGVEVLFDFADGRKIPTVVNAAPVYDENGEITAAIAVFEDITALQEVERLKAEFLSMVTHDLKGPLATIKGLSSSLLMKQGPRDIDTFLEFVNSIDEEADRMAELVSNLLEMSRIEANAMPMDPELCHLADIATESVRHVERSRIGGQHKITVDVPLELPEIYADYDQISRVFSNLVSNAIKYSPPDSEITIRSYIDPDDSHTIITEVKDNGVGISEGELDKIFDKFYRVTSQTGRGRPGSGLGLAICKAIAQSHDGKIWVESEPGIGSTFFFSLPASDASVGYD